MLLYDGGHEILPRGWPTDRKEVLEWIKQGRNPFDRVPAIYYKPAFHEASERKDLDLMLHLVAEPGTAAWTKRFLFCRNIEVAVPAKGRACISSLNVSCGGGRWYIDDEGNSMEGLEVLMMYGYKLSERADLGRISSFDEFLVMSDDDQTHLLKMVKFYLATTSSSLATGESSSDIGKNHL
jgi:hypothetical protein